MKQVDVDRWNALLRPDGVLIPPRLAGWVRSLMLPALEHKRQNLNGIPGLADDILAALDALRSVADNGPPESTPNRIDIGDAEGVTAILSTRQCAQITGLSERHIRRLCRMGVLAGGKNGHDWTIRETDLNDFRFRKSEYGRNREGNAGGR